MVICIGVALLLLGPWLPCPSLWANLGLVFPVPGMWAYCWVLFAYPGLWGFCLVVLLVVPVCGCWVVFFMFDWLFVLVVPICG